MRFTSKIVLLTLAICGLYQNLCAQTSDEIFTAARTKAFDEKNYPVAIELAKSALLKSPDYTEIP